MLARLCLYAMVCCALVTAFAPSRLAIKSKSAVKAPVSMSVFDNAVEEWAKTYPFPYSIGWGPTTKAERWNGKLNSSYVIDINR